MSAHRRHYFAPGAIEHHVFSRAHQRRALRRWLKRALVVMGAAFWFLLVFTAVSSPAHAQTTGTNAEARHPLAPAAIGLHIGSHHFDARQTGAWNDINPGIYARWASGVVVGTLRNSERRQSVYVGKVFETPRWHSLGADVTVGGITGYARAVSPLLALSGSLKAGNTTARLSYLPKAHPKASAALHLSTEWSF